MRIAGAILALVLTAGAPPSEPASAATPTDTETETIQGRVERDQRLTIPVRIDGRGPYDFVVDTGSQRSIVAVSIAARLALRPARALRIIDIGGRKEVAAIEADEIGIGTRSYAGVVMPVMEDDNLGAEGVIGTDNLQQQRVLIDFARNRMLVGSPRELGGNAGYEIIVTARRKSGQLIITEAVIDGVKTAVLIDTGAATSVGNRALQVALSHRHPSQQVTLISVTGTEIVADIGLPRRLSIGDVAITNLVVAYADSPVFPALDLAKRPALMLGMRELRLFQRVAIDFGSRKVLFDLPSGVAAGL